MTSRLISFYLFLILPFSLLGGLPAFGEVSKGIGAPMKFELGYGIMVNEKSSLMRNWIVVNDEKMPAKIVRYDGVDTTYDLEDRRWLYEADFELEFTEAISAVEVRIIPFNIWGEKDRTLTSTEIEDFSVGTQTMSSKWRSSESDSIKHFASIAYVYAVRTPDGRVLRTDQELVVQEAKFLSNKFSVSDLELSDVKD